MKTKNKKIKVNTIKKIKQLTDVLGKLPKDFKKKWVNALRSGKYLQGDGLLRDIQLNEETNKNEVKFCCLGVACHIAGASGITNKGFISNTFDGVIKSINKVPKILHGNDDVPEILAELNDEGYTFEQIADFIEEYL